MKEVHWGFCGHILWLEFRRRGKINPYFSLVVRVCLELNGL